MFCGGCKDEKQYDESNVCGDDVVIKPSDIC